MKTIPVAICLLQHEGRIPLIQFKRNYLTGFWGLPGGKFDDGEFLPEAAAREMGEELGLAVTFEAFHGVIDEIVVATEGSWRILLHACTVRPKDPADPLLGQRRDTPEGTIDWFTPVEIMAAEESFVASDLRIIQALLAGELGGYYRCRQRISADAKPALELFERAA